MKINMKSFGLFFALMLVVGILGAQTQQSLQVTAIFPKNFCQNYNSARESTFKIEFQIAGLTDQSIQKFNAQASKTDGVVSFTLGSLQHGLRLASVELAPQVDFDFIKTFLQDNGVRFINEEDVVVSIYDWKPFTMEQCKNITQLNQQIINIETKLNYVQQDQTQRSMAEGNGWFVEANNNLTKAKEAKKNYLESIK
jgi:hypothetical protein